MKNINSNQTEQNKFYSVQKYVPIGIFLSLPAVILMSYKNHRLLNSLKRTPESQNYFENIRNLGIVFLVYQFLNFSVKLYFLHGIMQDLKVEIFKNPAVGENFEKISLLISSYSFADKINFLQIFSFFFYLTILFFVVRNSNKFEMPHTFILTNENRENIKRGWPMVIALMLIFFALDILTGVIILLIN